MSRYVVLHAVPDDKICGLEEVENYDERLQNGQKAQRWKNVRFHMDPNFPKWNRLGDCLKSLARALVVSKQLKELIEAEQPAHVEYLPVSIIDHKGKVASADYFVINAFGFQDCIDKKASVIKWMTSDPGKMLSSTKLVLDEARISPNAKLFRLKQYPTAVIIRRELAEKIEEAGLTGVLFTELSDI